MPNLDEMKDKANQAAEDMKNRSGQQSGQPSQSGQPGQPGQSGQPSQSGQPGQPGQSGQQPGQPGQSGQQPAHYGQQTGQQTIEGESDEDDMPQEKKPGMMDEAKKRMDANEDGKFDADDLKKMGQDGVSKVKGMFNKKD